jgi:hypothetical protein
MINSLDLFFRVGWVLIGAISLSFGGFVAIDSYVVRAILVAICSRAFRLVFSFAESKLLEFTETFNLVFDRYQFQQINDPLLI